jgi:hypothetical protein
MATPSVITDGVGTKKKAEVCAFTNGDNHNALLVLTENFFQFNPTLLPFTNSTYGIAMNQNVTFAGTPELIFDGAGAGWTGTANIGTWNFADSGKVTITSANNNDSATWDDAGTIDMSSYTAITGKVDLDIYNEANNAILVQFGLAGVAVGVAVNLNDYIDTGIFLEQSFAIPKDDLEIDSLTVDEMTITMTRSGGLKPTVKFDDFQIEETGSPIVFKASTSVGRTRIKKFRFMIADNVASTVSTGTMHGLSYNKILGLSALTQGIVLQRVQDGKSIFTATYRQLSDFLYSGVTITNAISDGTNTLITLEVDLTEEFILIPDNGTDNFISITINDNLSGLLLFQAAAIGNLEV